MIIEAVLQEVYGVVNLHLIVIFRRLFNVLGRTPEKK